MTPLVTPSIADMTSLTRAVSRRTALLGQKGPLVERPVGPAHEMSVPESPRNPSTARSGGPMAPSVLFAAQMSLPGDHSSPSMKGMSPLLHESTSPLDPMTPPATEMKRAL